MMTAELEEWTGNKKAPLGGRIYRAWVPLPDSYAAVPMRPPTTNKPTALVMRQVLGPKLRLVNFAIRHLRKAANGVLGPESGPSEAPIAAPLQTDPDCPL